MVLEGFYKSKLQDSVQLQTVLALYEHQKIRHNEQPSCSRLKTSARRHIGQTMRTRNDRARNEIVGRGAVTKSQKREESQRGQESGRMRSVESNWKVDQRQEGQSSSPAPNAKAQPDGKIPSKSWNKMQDSVSKWRRCTNPSCNFWHPPVCLSYKSESGCTHGKRMPIPTR